MRRLSILLVLSLGLLPGCWWYSFSGASVPEGATTINIQTFSNEANLVNPTLAQDFTEALRQRFISQTTLSLTDQEGDLQLTGSIVDYRVTPVNITAGEQAATNRLTVVVRVRYTNTLDPNDTWEQNFSQFTDFAQTVNFTAEEASLVEEVSELLTQDIFQAALADW